ncbi:MAG: hypothetical protein ACI9EF_002033 [Pseudohongiellaceae bacterium]|jgi:hypothetical protein
MTAQQISPPTTGPSPASLQSPVLRSLQTLDAIEQHWEAMVPQLREHIPGLRSQRAFYDGAWVFGLRIGGRQESQTDKAALRFSRLDVHITLDSAHDHAEAISCVTVRNRDEPRQSFETTLDEQGCTALYEFIEGAAYTFVGRYFDRS